MSICICNISRFYSICTYYVFIALYKDYLDLIDLTAGSGKEELSESDDDCYPIPPSLTHTTCVLIIKITMDS